MGSTSRSMLRSAFNVSFLISALLLSRVDTSHADGKRGENVGTDATTGNALSQVSTALKKKGVTKVPSVTTSVKSSSSKIVAKSGDVSTEVISGTPPTLITIPGLSVKDLFWTTGVVDSLANFMGSDSVCRQFFTSTIDGDSGGLGACRMAQGVGGSFKDLIDAEASQCLLKNIPTKALAKAGAIKKTRGKYPDSDITKLFAPQDRSRTVIVSIPVAPKPDSTTIIPAEKVFVTIPSLAQNKRNGRLYSAELYFCPNGSTTARGFNSITVSDTGAISVFIANREDPNGGGSNILQFDGALTFADGAVVYDPAVDRTSTLNVARTNSNFKTNFTISNGGLIQQKLRVELPNSIEKTFTISRFSGDDASSVSFLEGAFSGLNANENGSNTFAGATEYREPRYLSAPTNALIDQVQSYNVVTDEFFNDAASTTFDLSKYDCSRRGDVEVSIVEGNEAGKAVLDSCLRNPLRSADFCRRTDVVVTADRNFRPVCDPFLAGGPPPTPSPVPTMTPPTPRPTPTRAPTPTRPSGGGGGQGPR